LANWFFDGARADVAKVVSANPAFQLTHAFALGSASKPASYNFGAIFANAQVSFLSFFTGSVSTHEVTGDQEELRSADRAGWEILYGLAGCFPSRIHR
jgi:hypothetical protein